MKPFSVVEAVKSGFSYALDHIGLWIGTILFSAGVMILGALGTGTIGGLFWFLSGKPALGPVQGKAFLQQLPFQYTVGGIIAALFLLVLWDIIRMGYIKISLNIVDGIPASLSTLFSAKHLVFRFIVISVLYKLVVLVGSLLLIVPGIIWGLQFGFVSQILVDKEVGIMEAFRISSRITKGQKLQLFGLYLVTGVLNLIGSAFYGIGLFIVAPITFMIHTSAYRMILSQQ